MVVRSRLRLRGTLDLDWTYNVPIIVERDLPSNYVYEKYSLKYKDLIHDKLKDRAYDAVGTISYYQAKLGDQFEFLDKLISLGDVLANAASYGGGSVESSADAFYEYRMTWSSLRFALNFPSLRAGTEGWDFLQSLEQAGNIRVLSGRGVVGRDLFLMSRPNPALVDSLADVWAVVNHMLTKAPVLIVTSRVDGILYTPGTARLQYTHMFDYGLTELDRSQQR